MHVTFFVPDIHHLQTGGNVYNRRMVEALRPETPVQIVSWIPEENSIPELDLPEESVIVVDSLLARHPEALQEVRAVYPAATAVLLVHYLRCIDPTTATPEVAAAERTSLEVVDGVITTGRFAQETLKDDGVPADRVRVVPPGMDERYRGPIPGPSGRSVPRMLTVANLVPEKGLQSFVEVLGALRTTSWTWTLVGDASLAPEYAAGVLRRVREAGLSERVRYTGAVPPETLRTWYDRADLFVLPSRFETRSLSMREAMARGLPVVGYRVGGVAENVGDASVGHLVRPDTPVALRSALRVLLTDPMMRGQRGRAAWRRSRAFPTWNEAAEHFRNDLERLCDRTSG